MNPYAEVLFGEKLVGTVPVATGADLQPVWNHQLPPHEFEVGQDLHVRVLDRNFWPRKDVLVGSGCLKLTPDLVRGDRKSVEKAVQLQKRHPGEAKPEFTGSVNISLVLAASSSLPQSLPPAESAPMPPPASSPTQSHTSSAVRPLGAAALPEQSRGAASNSTSRALNFDEAQPSGRPGDDASVVSSSYRPAAAALRPEEAEKRRKLVSAHYYEREVRKQVWRPVVCTAGVQQLWRKWLCGQQD